MVVSPLTFPHFHGLSTPFFIPSSHPSPPFPLSPPSFAYIALPHPFCAMPSPVTSILPVPSILILPYPSLFRPATVFVHATHPLFFNVLHLTFFVSLHFLICAPCYFSPPLQPLVFTPAIVFAPFLFSLKATHSSLLIPSQGAPLRPSRVRCWAVMQ